MRETKVTLTDTIKALTEDKKYNALREVLSRINPVDLAITFEELHHEKAPVLFRMLPKELAAETFVEMNEDMQQALIHGFSDNELKDIVDELYIDDAVDIIEEMPANVVNRILKQADAETRRIINELLKYPEDSAGSIMTTEYVNLTPHSTVKEAINRIRLTGVDKETIYTCYVTANDKTLIGIVTIKALLLAEVSQTVEALMQSNIISVNTLDDQEIVAQMFNKYNFLALPVVDKENRLVGIVTVDDAMDVMEEEATEDIQKMAAITPTDTPYNKLSAFTAFKNRIPWLLILMVSATFTGMIISSFESALATVGSLAMFIPMLMDTGGNSGSQTSVTIIRSLSLGEISLKDIGKIIFKELRIALLCGGVLGIVGFAKITLIDMLLLKNTGITPMIAIIVAITVTMTVIIAKFVGAVLPLLCEKIGFDPAVMASPLLTTIVDAIALFVYFQIATFGLKII